MSHDWDDGDDWVLGGGFDKRQPENALTVGCAVRTEEDADLAWCVQRAIWKADR